MDNTSLRGRFSLSTTNLTNPVAESTHINGSNLHSRFNWGEGTISLQSRNNTLRNNKNTSLSKHLTSTPPKVAMSPASRIDPRTYMDIHSNGLASRIVRYHDNSSPLNRSLSMGNLYNKPGQFPVVHLKKNETQYKAKKSKNLSMTRIAAPEKTVFQGNTLSSIFRSGSVVGLQKSDEEISRENRPILHPPPTENEMAPTPSVLEVLKEISRKRINSDEHDGTELIKKHCKEPDPISYHGQKTLTKRQREASSATATSPQISPEQQVVKKRMCSYNNDILSSLSSSILASNKRKMIDIQYQKQNTSDLATSSVQSTSSASRSEKQRSLRSFEFENLVAPLNYTPISPLPSTPQQSTNDKAEKNTVGLVTRRASEPVIITTKPKLTLFNRDYDEVPTEPTRDLTETREDGDLCGIQFVKPKKSSAMSTGGTLLMEKTKKSKLALMLSGLKGELNEDDEVDAPQITSQQPKQAELTPNVATTVAVASVVPPKQATLSFETKTTTAVTSVIPTSSPANKPASASTSPAVQVPAKTSIAPAVSTTSPSNGFQIQAPAVSTSKAPTSTAVSAPASATLTSVASTAPTIASPGGFSFGLNKSPSVPATATAATTTATTTPVTTKSPALPVAVQTSEAAGAAKPFTFGIGSAQPSTTTTTASGFNFGSPNKPVQAVLKSPAPSLVGVFGNPPAATTMPAATAAPVFGEVAKPSQPVFSFGSIATSSSSNTTPSVATVTPAQTTTTAPAPSFNFGGFKPSWNPSGNQPQPSDNTSVPKPGSFSIIAPASSQLAQPATTSASTASPGGFSFSLPTTEAVKPLFGSGVATATTTASTEPTKPLFGSMPATSSTTNSTPSFSFSNNKTSAPQANPSGGFNFGSATTAPGTSNTLPQPTMFGSPAPEKPSNSFSFAATAPATGPQLKPAFSFSSTDKPTLPTTTAGSSAGGFSFGSSSNSISTPADSSKNLFGSAAPAAPAKNVFSFGSPAAGSQTTVKPSFFGAPATTTTSLFPSTTASQNSPFTFGSSSASTNQQATTSTEPARSIFGAVASSNQTNGLSTTTSSTGSIFGGPSATVAPLQQSASFTFGAGSSTSSTDSNKPSGGFVFGSNSAIGSNASKPATDLNKTFVFGDGSTTITPAPSGSTNLFGSASTLSNANTEPKMFSFGTAGAVPASSVNTFGASRQTVNQSPVFNFGAAAPAGTPAPAQNGNLFAPQPIGAPAGMGDRRIRKATRRLHKT